MIRNLGQLAGRARRISGLYCLANEASYTIDYGEWSGPASARAEQLELNQLAQDNGFKDYGDLLEHITQRTSHHWVHFNMPHDDPEALVKRRPS
jgi:hypothetical protein